MCVRVCVCVYVYVKIDPHIIASLLSVPPNALKVHFGGEYRTIIKKHYTMFCKYYLIHEKRHFIMIRDDKTEVLVY